MVGSYGWWVAIRPAPASTSPGEEATLIELARRGEPVYPDLDDVLDLSRPTLD